MSFTFPETEILKLDLLGGVGGTPRHAKLFKGELAPAYSAYNTTYDENIVPTYAGYSDIAKRFVVCTGEKVLYSADGLNFSYVGALKSGKAFGFSAQTSSGAASFVFGDDEFVSFSDDKTQFTGFSCGMLGGVVKNGRAFGMDATDGYTIRWSGSNGVADGKQGIYEGGSLRLNPTQGKILNLVVFDGKLCAVRRFGVTEISAFGTPENFTVSYTAQTDEIYGDTAAVVGGKLLVYTREGLAEYSSGVLKRLDFPLNGYITSPECGAVFGNDYFVAGRDGSGKIVTLAYNSDGYAYIIDYAPKKIVVCERGLFMYGGGASTDFKKAGYTFESNKFDFGSHGEKTLTDLLISADGEVTVTVKSGKKSVRRKCGDGRTHFGVRGRKFCVTVEADCKIGKIEAYAEVESGI